MRHWPVLIGISLLAACSRVEGEQAATGETTAASTASAASNAPAVQGRKVEISNDLMEFEYSYPAEAAAIPALKAMFDSEIEDKQGRTREGTLADREAAKDGGWEPHIYAHSTDWKVVTEIPGWLSLSADRYEYTGGAHGNPWFDTVLWDKAANIRRNPTDLFLSKAALRKAIQPAVCDQIDRQREEKRGAPVVRGDGFFSDCIDPTEATVILGSSDRQHFNRIGVLVGPYLAGPYSEGAFEATVPVTPQVIAALKPEYRKFFAVKR